MLVCYLTRLNPTTCSSELWPLVHNDYNNNFFTYLSQPHQRDDIIIWHFSMEKDNHTLC